MRCFKTLVLLFVLASSLYSAASQIWLPNGVWTLVGYKGIYSGSSEANSWNDDNHLIIEDIADDKFTYVVNTTDETDHLYNSVGSGATASLPLTLTSNDTTQINSNIGVFAISDTTSIRETTTLDGSVTSSVQLKFSTVYDKDPSTPMYSMYVAGGSNTPAIRLVFQGSYSGDLFRVRFGEEEEAYVGYFNHESTYDNPAILVDENDIIEDLENTMVDVREVFDYNITDNNITTMQNSTFSLTNDVTAYDSDSGNTLQVSKLALSNTNTDGVWEHFNSANTNTASNAFTQLEVGQGYWVRGDSQLAHNDFNRTKIGLLTSSTSQLQNDYLNSTQDGWNLLMFKDSHLRYVASGVIMTDAQLFNSTVLLQKPDASGGATVNNSIDLNSTATSSANFLNNNVKSLNTIIEAFNLLFAQNVRMRAFPASTIAGVRSMVLVSDSLIYLAENVGNPIVGNITSLAGEPIIQLNEQYLNGGGAIANARTTYSSRYGEYMLVANLNDLNASEINASIAISSPSVSTNTGRAYDLNDTNNSTKAQAILDAFEDSIQDSGDTNQTIVNVILVDTDMNSSDSYSSTLATLIPQMNAVLLASGERFSIADTTYTKAYRYHRNGDFRIIGSNARTITMDNTVDITALATQFDSVATDTSIDFQRLGQDTDGNEYFAITSNATSNIDLLENENNGTTLFEEISLNSTVIPEANRSYIRGAITNVYSIENLLNTRVDFNNTDALVANANLVVGAGVGYGAETFSTTARALASTEIDTYSGLFTTAIPSLTTDLRSNVIWAVDFPRDSIINQFAQLSNSKRIESMITMDVSMSLKTYWKATDLTKDPGEWYGNTYNADEDEDFDNDYQGIFSLDSHKAYWVKLSPKSNIRKHHKRQHPHSKCHPSF